MKQLNFWERLFPQKYNFYAMITEQSAKTAEGITLFGNWLKEPGAENAAKLRLAAMEADNIRFSMEARLIEAFVTPFDRQDIYTLSVEMDRIIETALSLMELMIAYEAEADDTIFAMALNLDKGAQYFYTAVSLLEKSPLETEKIIADIRRCQVAIEEGYRHGAAELIKSGDMVKIVKQREIYHHLLDAAIYLGYTVDILHKIVVRIA